MGYLDTASNLATIAALGVGVLGLGVTRVIVASRTPMAKPVANLWPKLQHHVTRLKKPIVHFSLNPYTATRSHYALVLQGNNKLGKTTLFATSIPWYRRYGPLSYKGLIFNGAAGTAVDSFEKWHTSQLFGTSQAGGSELEVTLTEYRSRQIFRGWLSTFGFPIAPRPAWVIVDQFEELVKRFPDSAVGWAHHLTNLQHRDSLAKAVFVVHSPAGSATLRNLNQGVRFDFVEMTPISMEEASRVPLLEVDRFLKCGRNIGMYKDTLSVPLANLKAVVDATLMQWRENYNLLYPAKYDRSWHMPDAAFKETLLKCLQHRLEAEAVYTPEEIDAGLAWTRAAFKYYKPSVLRDMPWSVWCKSLHEEGAHAAAEGLATFIKHTLAVPVSNQG